MTKQAIRILVNGKSANNNNFREAVFSSREKFNDHDIQVRVTWEQGDLERMIGCALREDINHLVIGGGDGSINEAAQALLSKSANPPVKLGILPLGTANDFATACGVPSDAAKALELAITGQTCKVDAGRCNDRYFVNVAAGGFGAQVTAETPSELKNFLGGSAYTLTGLVRALDFSPFKGHIQCDSMNEASEVIVAAVCNGRQAGGGQQLAPNARINDGMFDVILISAFPLNESGRVLRELFNPDASGRYVKRFRTDKILCEFEAGDIAPVNLDGEPYSANTLKFEILPKVLPFVLPEDSPALHG